MRKRYLFPAIGVLTTYLTLPFIMGAREVGFRRGPVFYPEWLHAGLFISGCEAFNGYKPRQSTVQILYRRAYFYGFAERKKSEAECAAIKAELKARNSPLLNMIEEEERRTEDQKTRRPSKAPHPKTQWSPLSNQRPRFVVDELRR